MRNFQEKTVNRKGIKMKRLLAFLLIFALLLPQNVTASSDVSEYLEKAQADGVIFGDENGNLQGDKEATRAEFLAIAERFWHLSGGENVFSDVKESDWFCKSIASAKFCGIFAGTPEGEAKPYEIIKTEDAVSIIGRYYNATNHKGKYVGLSPYAEDYFGYAFENGLFSGWKHLPNPKQGITKGEIVSLFYGYKERNEQEDCFAEGYPKLSQSQQFGTLSVEIMTKKDCDISYAVKEKSSDAYKWTDIPETMHMGEIRTIKITADMEKIYDLYVKAISKENGLNRISGFSDVAPLSFIKGNGSRTQPYVIYTEKQLKQIEIFPKKAFVLGADITVSEKWKPIKTIKGSLDGAGYRISGIKISGVGQRVGLFEKIEGGTVKNLAVDADIKAKEIAGVIAGENEGNIEGCTVTGTVEVTGGSGGGLCGINLGRISDCLSSVYSVKAGSFAGG
ncbi:MAG: S-layer homology domain-containing protein, partial [Clostridia bacterium]|nr:S-layer homology domain-containing protein [Clostridia bacterium]